MSGVVPGSGCEGSPHPGRGEAPRLIACFLFYALLIAVYLGPALIGRRALMPVDLLYRLPPWAASAPLDLPRYTNLILTDPVQQFYPWMRFAIDSLSAGGVPDWNPFVFLGTPFSSNPQTALYSPFTLPFWILPLWYGFGVSAFLKLWVGAVGMHLLVSRRAWGLWPTVFAASAYALSPFQVVWLSHPVTSVFAWLPLGLWLAESVLASRKHSSVVALALVVSAFMLSGHPGSQVHLVAGLTLFGLVHTLITDASWRVKLKGVIAAGAAVGMGILAAAPAWVPFLWMLPDSHGLRMRAGGGGILPVSALMATVLPDWWGNPTVTLAGGPANYNERMLFIGSVPLLALVVGIFARRPDRQLWPFLALAVAGIGIPLGLEPLHWFTTWLPGLSSVNNVRLIGLFHVGAIVLAAFCVSAIARSETRSWQLACLGLLFLATIYLYDRAAVDTSGWTRLLRAVIAPAYALVSAADLRAGALLRLGGLIILFSATILSRSSFGARCCSICLVVLTAAELVTFSYGFQPMPPADLLWQQTPPSVGFLQQHIGHSRMAGLLSVFFPEAGMVYGLRDVRGYSAPQPDGRLERLVHPATPSLDRGDMLSFPEVTADAARLFDLLAVRYVMTDAGAAIPGYFPAYKGRDAAIFENPTARERVFVPATVVHVNDENQARITLFSPEFDARHAAVVEGSDTAVITGAEGDARIVTDLNEEILIEATMRGKGIVVLADAFAPGWTATVDGVPARSLRVDSVLRGVEVESGVHEIRWRYRQPGRTAALVISTVAVMVLAAIGLSGRRYSLTQKKSG